MSDSQRMREVRHQLETAEHGTTLVMEGMVWTCFVRYVGYEYRVWKLNKLSDWPSVKVAQYLLTWEDRYSWCMY